MVENKTTFTKDNSKNRNEITILRILSMFSIVLCHIIIYYSFIPGHNFLGQVFNVGVEIFILISGYLYGSKIISNFFSWYKKRIRKIYIPALIVIVIDIIVLAIVYSYKYNVWTIVMYMFNLQGVLHIHPTLLNSYISKIDNIGPLWFTTVIMICYLLIPLLQKTKINIVKKNKYPTIIILLICIVLFLVSLLVQILVGSITIFFPIFVLGYFLPSFESKLLDSRIKSIFIYIISISLQIIRLFLKTVLDETLIYDGIVSVSHFALAFGIFWFFLRMGKVVPRICEKIGSNLVVKTLDNYSFYVYLTHGLFCMGITNVYTNNHLWVSSLMFIGLTIIASFVLKNFDNLLTLLFNQIIKKKKNDVFPLH